MEKKRIASYVDPCYNINCQKLKRSKQTADRSKSCRLFSCPLWLFYYASRRWNPYGAQEEKCKT
nr:MAG TPA: hypothetical protein [Caudoviricetes sp.]